MPARVQVPIERIRQLLAQGVSVQAIARRLAISECSVGKVATRMRQEGLI